MARKIKAVLSANEKNNNEQIQLADFEAQETETAKATEVKVTKKKSKATKIRIPVKKVDYVPEEGSLEEQALKSFPEGAKDPFGKLSKKVDMSLFDISDIDYTKVDNTEIRALVRAFYHQYQPNRIVAENIERSLIQGASHGDAGEIISDNPDLTSGIPETLYIRFPVMARFVDMNRKQEEVFRKIIENYIKSTTIGQYLTSIAGIGPLLAACFIAYLKPRKYAGQVFSYVGLNDNNDPWIKSEDKINYIMDTFCPNEYISEKDIAAISAYTGRAVGRIIRGARVLDPRFEDGKHYIITRKSLKSYLKKPPFNRELKKVCWKLGESILKLKNNAKSKYGALLTERLAYEHQKNDNLEYIQEAMKALDYAPKGQMYRKDMKLTHEEELERLHEMQHLIDIGAFNGTGSMVKIDGVEYHYNKLGIGKTTQTFKTYYDGKLGDGHILQRAKRWVVKLILSHIFEAMYIDTYGSLPPAPYIIASDPMHNKYIEPEVPYSMFWDIDTSNMQESAIEAYKINEERKRAMFGGSDLLHYDINDDDSPIDMVDDEESVYDDGKNSIDFSYCNFEEDEELDDMIDTVINSFEDKK